MLDTLTILTKQGLYIPFFVVSNVTVTLARALQMRFGSFYSIHESNRVSLITRLLGSFSLPFALISM